MKIQVYRAVIVATLQHGAETWVHYRKAYQATQTDSPMLLVVRPRQQMERLCVKRRSHQDSLLIQHGVHLALDAAA